MLQFVKDLESYQMMAPQKAANVRPQLVGYGCGHGPSPACLEGWTGQDILMFRHGTWNRGGVFDGFLVVDYGNVTIHQPAEGRTAARAVVDVPRSEGLKWVLASVGGSSMVNAGANAQGAANMVGGTGFVPGSGALMNL